MKTMACSKPKSASDRKRASYQFVCHSRKLAPITTALALLAIPTLLVACKQQVKPFTEQSASTVVFADAGLSIDVGDGWKRINISPGPPTCTPTLVSERGVVGAELFTPGSVSIKEAVDGLRATFNADAGAVKDSYRQEEFVADSGVHGLHVSYVRLSERNGKTTEMHCHDYIITNSAGNCVSVTYFAPAKSDSDQIRQMIRKSLRLQ